MRVLWVGCSDLAVVLDVSFVGSDLAVIVFQKVCCYCGWVDLKSYCSSCFIGLF